MPQLDRHHAGSNDLHGRGAINRVAKTELTIVVLAHSPKRTIALYEGGMVPVVGEQGSYEVKPGKEPNQNPDGR